RGITFRRIADPLQNPEMRAAMGNALERLQIERIILGASRTNLSKIDPRIGHRQHEYSNFKMSS
ncbi:MAG: hypothetical protein AAF890_09270, partial [Pseudomonadota bacterium]